MFSLTEFKLNFNSKLKINHPDTALYLRGDSGFVTPALYELLEQNSTSYTIRLKVNLNLY